MIKIYDSKGMEVEYSEQRIDGGAEGGIYNITNYKSYNPQKLILKLFENNGGDFQTEMKNKEQKIIYMLKNPPKGSLQNKDGNENVTIAWPYEIVYKSKNRVGFIGYIMPKIQKVCSIGQILTAQYRIDNNIVLNVENRLKLARNMAKGFLNLHANGYYGIDGNPDNYLVCENGNIAFIDTDAYNIVANGQVYKGNCYCENMAPREYLLADEQKRPVPYSATGDKFILALYIFRIMMDVWPHVGIPVSQEAKNVFKKKSSDKQRTGVINGWFVYSKTSRHLRPRDSAPDYDAIVPSELKEGFLSTFVAGHTDLSKRFSPQDWIKAISSALISIEKPPVGSKLNKSNIFTSKIMDEICPVICILDETVSLMENGAWEPLCRCFRNMFEQLKLSKKYESIMFSYVEFAANAEVHDFVRICKKENSFKNINLQIRQGGTDLMKAVKKAIENCDRLIDACMEKGIEIHHPKVLIMTDGIAIGTNEDFKNKEEFYQYLESKKEKGRYEFVCLALGDDLSAKDYDNQTQMLSKISSTGKFTRITGNYDTDLGAFFNWFSTVHV